MDKLSLLNYLAGVLDAGASDVAQTFQVPLPTAAMALLRLTRSGLATRALDLDRDVFFYAITPKGRDRVQYFSRRAR